MKITKRELKKLIENYLWEDETDNDSSADEDVVEEEPVEEEDPMEEEEPVEEEDPMEDEAAAEEEEPVDEKPEPGEGFPDIFKSFEIVVDNIKHKIQFVKDNSAGVLKVLIDDTPIVNPKPQHFVTLAGIGLQGVKDEDLKGHLAKVVKLDKSYEKFGSPNEVGNQVKRKMDGSRPGYTDDDIRKIGLGKGSNKG